MSEQVQFLAGRLTRRMLLAAAGTVTGGLALPGGPPQMASSAEPGPHGRRGKDRAFVADEGFRNTERDGRKGFQLKVRLTSYRSLPLSCIEGVKLKIDGQEIDPKDIVLTLNNYSHKLDELPRLSGVWWFILDCGELFVPYPKPLAAGEHLVEATLITVEPYMTAGRFSFYSACSKRLALEPEI